MAPTSPRPLASCGARLIYHEHKAHHKQRDGQRRPAHGHSTERTGYEERRTQYRSCHVGGQLERLLVHEVEQLVAVVLERGYGLVGIARIKVPEQCQAGLGEALGVCARAYEAKISQPSDQGEAASREKMDVATPMKPSRVSSVIVPIIPKSSSTIVPSARTWTLLIEQDVLVNADKNNVGTITCDLRTKRFVFSDGPSRASCKLQHGDSAFVECVEGVQLPHTIAARVLLKNSRIREGLALDAPLYFPGHRTIVYYRVTNVSTDTIILDSARPIAQIAFERVEKPVDNAYEGTFQDEMEFRGMGRYEDVYRDEIERIENTVDEIKSVERKMYGNVMAIMAILAGIFTLVNVNVRRRR